MEIDNTLLRNMLTNRGDSLLELSNRQPVLLVFLRHFGCTFCREALSDIAKRKSQLEADGTIIIFVHMTSYDIADTYFNRYKLNGAINISDPDCEYYQAFGLTKGNFTQLFGLQSWIRGFQSGIVEGNGLSYKQIGDGFQMPGVFVLHEGDIKSTFIHKMSHDRPDYLKLVENCCKIP